MGKETATLIAAVIAACAALATTALTGWRQYQLERERWREARLDSAEQAARLAIADLGKQLAFGIHAIGWLTWKAQEAPDTLTTEDVAAYEKEMKTLLPAVASAHLVVVALDNARAGNITPIVNRFYLLDANTAHAGIRLMSARSEGLRTLQACYEESRQLKTELHAELASAMYASGAESDGSRPTRR